MATSVKAAVSNSCSAVYGRITGGGRLAFAAETVIQQACRVGEDQRVVHLDRDQGVRATMGAADEDLAGHVGKTGLEPDGAGVGPEQFVQVGREEGFVVGAVGQRLLLGGDHTGQHRVVLVKVAGGQRQVVSAAVLAGAVQPRRVDEVGVGQA